MLKHDAIVVGDDVVIINEKALFALASKALKTEGSRTAKLRTLEDEIMTTISPIDRKQTYLGRLPLSIPRNNPGVCSWPAKDILSGLTVVLGMTKSGKTHWIQNELQPDVVIRLGEPAESIDLASDDDSEKGGYSRLAATSPVEATMLALGASLMGYTVAIDSLRVLVYNTNGPALPGGAVGAMFTLLTSMSNVFSAYDVHVVATLNPMITEEVQMAAMNERVESSVVGAAVISQQRLVSYVARLADGRRDIVGTDGMRDSKHAVIPPSPFVLESIYEDDTISMGLLSETLPALGTGKGEGSARSDPDARKTKTPFSLDLDSALFNTNK